MLNYKVKLSNGIVERKEVVWGEKYLSPDLSFASGVTSQDYHLEKLTKIEASMEGKSDLLNIEAENVTREGYVIVNGKKYKKNGTSVLINGKYYKVSDGKVNNWLIQSYDVKNGYDGKYFVPGTKVGEKTFSESGNYVKLDTIYWIENGKVNIDGNSYIFDRDEVTDSSKGALKYFNDGPSLPATGVTDCDSIEFYPIANASDFIDVTKFSITRDEYRSVEFDTITYISHFYYVKYNGEYYPIEISGTKYVCKIGSTSYDVKYFTDSPYGTTSDLTTSIATDYEEIGDFTCQVELGGGCVIPVDGTVQNANSGRKLGIYLTDTYNNINVGDIITVQIKSHDLTENFVVESDSNGYFVINDGTRYNVVSGMMNTVKIDGVEYDIKRCDDTNCFVDIDGEEVPMKKSGEKLERYGYVLQNGSKVKASYDIQKYSGVTIGGVDYRVISIENGAAYILEAEPDRVYKLIVTDVIGNSLIVCEPALDSDDFTIDYINNKVIEISDRIVSGQNDLTLYKKNSLFGDKEVLPNTSSEAIDKLILYARTGYISIPLKLEAGIESNHLIDDIRDRDFVDYETQKAINPIIDMERDIYVPKYIDNQQESIAAYTAAGGTFPQGMTDEEKNHAYIGSFTDFKPVTEIQINPHFRTRDFSSWKVNDGYNNASSSGITDNWFITDYEPYKTILSSTTTTTTGSNPLISPEEMAGVSDLLGLLYFSNMDVFYQKTALAKSFMRLSYYDDTNPQTQTLLHTSTVFMDEHNLFKKFIDNSRKNVYDYMLIQEPVEEQHIEEEEETTTETEGGGTEPKSIVYETHPSILNKISVMSEFIGIHDKIKSKSDCYDPENCYTFSAANITNEDRRISSRLTIRNKYATDTSSEGFYVYIFKQYAKNLHPKPIYMKFDFNHAKIGKTIPFNIPMKWEKSSKETDKSPYVYPTAKLTLSTATTTDSKSDINTLKEGFPLSYVYGQGYVPLYAMYDFKNKEYAYVFDSRYVTDSSIINGVVRLNLFELKVKNNEDGTAVEKTARININNKQIVTQ